MRAWFVYGCNLPSTLPNPAKVRKALEAIELVVAIDILPAEVTGYADVVLPECTFLERHEDLEVTAFRTPFIAIRQPVVPPMYESKPAWWMAKELSKRIKINGETLEKYFPYKHLEEKIKNEVETSGYSYVELKEKGAIVRNANIYDDSPTFHTPSGKIELFSKTLGDAGFDPLPNFTPPEDPPEGYFRLLFGRHPVHTFSRTSNNHVALEIFPENEIWINVEMAKIMGIKDGMYVILKNQDGIQSNKVKAKVTQRIRQDCVYMVHGFGGKDKRLTKAYNRGASDSDLISRYKEDPIMGGTGMNINFVTLEKA